MESVCAGNRTVGSNPTLSATLKKGFRTWSCRQARNSAVFLLFRRRRTTSNRLTRARMKPENRIFSESLNPQNPSSTTFLRKSTAWLRGGLNPSRSTEMTIPTIGMHWLTAFPRTRQSCARRHLSNALQLGSSFSGLDLRAPGLNLRGQRKVSDRFQKSFRSRRLLTKAGSLSLPPEKSCD